MCSSLLATTKSLLALDVDHFLPLASDPVVSESIYTLVYRIVLLLLLSLRFVVELVLKKFWSRDLALGPMCRRSILSHCQSPEEAAILARDSWAILPLATSVDTG